MKIIVLKNKKQAAKISADIISKSIKKNKKTVLGLPTGKTMIPIYKKLVNFYKNKKIDFSKVVSFNIDEYVDSNEFHKFMRKNLFSKVNMKERNINFPNEKVKKYEKEIKNVGGIDLIILGIGRNGHIGFNEPGSSKKSVTRKIKLSKETRKVNKLGKKKITEAYTMGIKTILSSKKIILIATGKDKSEVVWCVLTGKISSKVPASFLMEHKNVTFVLDEAAAEKLNE